MKKAYVLLLSFTLLLLVDEAKAQLKLGDQPTSVQKSVILDLQGSNGRQGVWLPRISDTSNATGIDGLNPPDGVMIYHTPSSQLMIRVNGYWQSLVPTTGIYTISHNSQSVNGPGVSLEIGTAAGGTKDFNIDVVPGQDRITFNLPDASNDTRGVVTINSQTFSGLKTFNNGLTSESTTTVNGSSSNASNLYLGISSSTSPGATTDRFLSVNSSGRVILSEGIPSTRTMTINGTTYNLSANRTWNVGTVTSVAGGYGVNGGTITTSGTFSVDTNSIATRAWRQKGIDSVAGLLNAYIPSTRTLNGLALSANQTFATGTSGTDFGISSSGTTHTFNLPTASSTNRGLLSNTDWTTFNNKVSTSRTLTINGTSYDLSANRTWSVGTVTSVAGGYGISGGTITSTGTHSVDTFSVSSRAWRQKGIDSIAGLLNAYVPASRTLNGLALSSNQTFAAGTAGTDFNISSSGTTHTFNIPDASATARGVVTTGSQTFDGSKTFSDPVSAKVNLQAGTASAGTAPLKFTSGTNLATPENGAMEYNGTNYFVTSGGTRYTLAKTLTNTATLDFPSTAPLATSTLNITVNGAVDGDVVTLGVPSGSMNASCAFIAYVSAANTVTVSFINYSGGNVNPASGTFRVSVLKY